MNMQRDGCTIGLDRTLKLILDDAEDIHSKSQILLREDILFLRPSPEMPNEVGNC